MHRPSILRPFVQPAFLSIFVSFTVISAHEAMRGESWSISLCEFLFGKRDYSARLTFDDYRANACSFFLIWGCAISLFALLALFQRRTTLHKALLALSTVTSVLLYPLICVLQSNRQLFLQLELVAAILLTVLFLTRKSPLGRLTNAIFLALHFAFWSWLGGGHLLPGGWYMFWPGWSSYWKMAEYAWLLYPFLGFCSALACFLSVSVRFWPCVRSVGSEG